MRWCRCVLIGLAALIVGVADGSARIAIGPERVTARGAGSGRPVTLVSESVPIYSFVQGGGRLAWWIDDGSWSGSVIKIRPAAGGDPVVVDRPDGGDGPYSAEVFALSGRRVVWAGFVDCCNSSFGIVGTAAPGSKPRELRELGQGEEAWGDYPTGAAGDGDTLVYSIVTVEPFYGSDDKVESWGVTGGGVWRVVGARDVRVPAVPPTTLLAAAQGAIALVPADLRRVLDRSNKPVSVQSEPNARVEIRNAVSGAIRTSFRPGGRVTALGMDAHTVAVLVRSGRTALVKWYSAESGTPVGSKSVEPNVADMIGVSGRFIVFRRARVILALDTRTGRTSELAQARSVPEGLSIEGTRVAWVERLGVDKDGFGGHGTIRAINVR